MSSEISEIAPTITFQEAFNQAIASLDIKATLQLMYALNSKALYLLEESKPKGSIIKPTNVVL